MAKITKEYLKNAYLNNEKKRSFLLYEYYKEEYFHKGYPAKFIATSISEDLGITVTLRMIYLITDRIIKKQKAALPSQPVTTPPAVDTFSSKQVIKEEKTAEMEKVQDKKPMFDYYATEKPKPNPFLEALKDHIPKNKQ